MQSLLTYFTLNTLLGIIGILLLLLSAFLLGVTARSSQLWYDRWATWRIRRYATYRVGDRVTLGNNVHGTVTGLTPVSTVLTTPAQTKVTFSNSFVLRHPIYVHPAALTEPIAPKPAPNDMVASVENAYLPATNLSLAANEPTSPAMATGHTNDFAETRAAGEMPPAEKAQEVEFLPFADQTIAPAEDADLSQAPEPVTFEFSSASEDKTNDQEPAEASPPEGVRFIRTSAAPLPMRPIARLTQRPKLGRCTVRAFHAR
ncbi:MAG: mechanosensitive ion channel family protein [Caldilineaceae bacterium]